MVSLKTLLRIMIKVTTMIFLKTFMKVSVRVKLHPTLTRILTILRLMTTFLKNSNIFTKSTG